MTKADRFNADKKEIIERLSEMIKAVRAASTPAALDDLARARGDRATNLSAKLAGSVIDYVHSR